MLPVKSFFAAVADLKVNREELVAAGAVAEGVAGLCIVFMRVICMVLLVYPLNFIAPVLLFRAGNTGQCNNINGQYECQQFHAANIAFY